MLEGVEMRFYDKSCALVQMILEFLLDRDNESTPGYIFIRNKVSPF